MIKVALQLYSVREELEKDFFNTLSTVKDMGYDAVELAGLYEYTPQQIKEYLDKINLKAISAHIPLQDLTQDTMKVLSDYKTIGCEYVVIPYLTEDYRLPNDKFYDVITHAKNIGKIANELGMTLLYHNHDFEFEKIDDKYALDHIYENVDKSLLQCEIDTCWVNIAGENPSEYLKKYENRTPIVHLKDFAYLDNGKKEFEFRPLGKGIQDFDSIIKTSISNGTKYFVIEQDNASMNLTPMESAKLSISFLKEKL